MRIALAAANPYFTAAGILIQITPLFARGRLGADAVGVGVTIGAFSVTALFMRPWTGRLADRRGRRPLFIAGALLAALAIAAHTLTADLAVLIGLRLVLGVAEALFFVAGFAILANLAPPNRAGEALRFNSLTLPGSCVRSVDGRAAAGDWWLHAGVDWRGGAGGCGGSPGPDHHGD